MGFPSGKKAIQSFSRSRVLRNSFKRLELGLNANASQAASEKRRQEERMNGFAAEIKAIRKDLQSVKADVQGVSFFVKSINKPVL